MDDCYLLLTKVITKRVVMQRLKPGFRFNLVMLDSMDVVKVEYGNKEFIG